jgi:hypothetical protein
LADLATEKRVKIKTVPVKELDVLSHGHQGAGIEVLEAPELNWETLGQGKNNLLLGLDGIEDPQNLGAILRSAWVFGATGILLPSSRAMSPTLEKSGHLTKAGEVTVSEALEDVEALGLRDLREKYQGEKDEKSGRPDKLARLTDDDTLASAIEAWNTARSRDLPVYEAMRTALAAVKDFLGAKT